MKNNRRLTFTTFALVEIVLIIFATLGLQFFLFRANQSLKQADSSLQTLVQQTNALAFVEPALVKENLISAELTAYPTGEAVVNTFIGKLQNIAKVTACELDQVTVQAVSPVTPTTNNEAETAVTTTNNETGTGTGTATTTSQLAFSLVAINVQINANYSELINFVAQIRKLPEIVGLSTDNFELPLDARSTKKNFISLPIFFIFKTN